MAHFTADFVDTPLPESVWGNRIAAWALTPLYWWGSLLVALVLVSDAFAPAAVVKHTTYFATESKNGARYSLPLGQEDVDVDLDKFKEVWERGCDTTGTGSSHRPGRGQGLG